MTRVGFAKSADPDKVAHIDPPHLDLHCLPFVVKPKCTEQNIVATTSVRCMCMHCACVVCACVCAL